MRNEYTFIGPVKGINDFVTLVHEQDPDSAADFHHSLKSAYKIKLAIAKLTPDTPLTIYIATTDVKVKAWVPSWNITDYCKNRGIALEM